MIPAEQLPENRPRFLPPTIQDFALRYAQRRANADRTLEWLTDTCNGLTDLPAKITLYTFVENMATYRITADRPDIGRLIGIQGRVVRSLRMLLMARGGKDRMRYDVIVEPETKAARA